jgi:predicted nucleic acid-binding protein
MAPPSGPIFLRCAIAFVTNNTAEFARVPGLNMEDWKNGP